MRLIKYLPLIAFWGFTAFTMKAGADVKSYREWKTERVQTAQNKVMTLKAQIDLKKSGRSLANGTDPNMLHRGGLEAVSTQDMSVEKLERELREEAYDLEVAKDLSVTDYFVGYLTKVQDKKTAFNEVAGKLSPEEVAELMTAYANSVFGAHSADLPVSANNLSKDGIK
ncbi:hypothetical protein EZJ49_05210 [Bdellovibrio bacteriovorus]|uniref:hypothetical protein n=1 Tax=Bdellovibrio bacteriovorus TaxID=959 RepID=UPI0021D12382|nr:hypothetical protein [Bdellovibrio bacteriovorus]UXR65649.1 hypothetical protein EZJ49_05210 [Bdellovibrio bacteriovorus]